MKWTIITASKVKKQTRQIDARSYKKIREAILEIQKDPFSGDTKVLRNHRNSTIRRRVGRYRILYSIQDYRQGIVVIEEITKRDENTYK